MGTLEAAAAKLLDFSQPIDVPLLDATVSAFYSATNPPEVGTPVALAVRGVMEPCSQGTCVRALALHRQVGNTLSCWGVMVGTVAQPTFAACMPAITAPGRAVARLCSVGFCCGARVGEALERVPISFGWSPCRPCTSLLALALHAFNLVQCTRATHGRGCAQGFI